MNLKEELKSMKLKFGIYTEQEILSESAKEPYIKLLKEGKPMPWDIRCKENDYEPESSDFFRITKTDMTEEEIAEYLRYKELKMLRTIKNCVVFFTTLAVISLVCGALSAIILLVPVGTPFLLYTLYITLRSARSCRRSCRKP